MHEVSEELRPSSINEVELNIISKNKKDFIRHTEGKFQASVQL